MSNVIILQYVTSGYIHETTEKQLHMNTIQHIDSESDN